MRSHQTNWKVTSFFQTHNLVIGCVIICPFRISKRHEHMSDWLIDVSWFLRLHSVIFSASDPYVAREFKDYIGPGSSKLGFKTTTSTIWAVGGAANKTKNSDISRQARVVDNQLQERCHLTSCFKSIWETSELMPMIVSCMDHLGNITAYQMLRSREKIEGDSSESLGKIYRLKAK
ncbi:hypothetical protein Bca4012_058166 [Brassica carinata]